MEKRDSRDFFKRKECEELNIYWISAALRFCNNNTILSQKDNFEAVRENKTKNEFLRSLP